MRNGFAAVTPNLPQDFLVLNVFLGELLPQVVNGLVRFGSDRVIRHDLQDQVHASAQIQSEMHFLPHLGKRGGETCEKRYR